jgi:hypothetical protein
MQHLQMAGTNRIEVQSIEAGAMDAVQRLTGRRLDGLKQTTPLRMDSKTVEVAGQVLHRDHWTTERRRWCPACWNEDIATASGNRPREWNVHRRFWWSVAAIGTCPIHKVRLKDTCPHPDCDRPVFSYIGGLHQCRNGHSLLTAEPETVDPSLTWSDSYILARLTGAAHAPVPLLDQLALGETIDAITRLGAAVVGGADITLKTRRGVREIEMMAAGFNIAQNWPHAFEDHLKIMMANGKGWGAEKTFGQLYRWAKDLAASAFAEELRRVFYGAIGEDRYVKPTSLVRAYVSDPTPTLKEVCKELGISSPTAHRYLEKLGYPVVGSKKGTPASISPEALNALTKVFFGQLDLVSAARYLGIARKHLRTLVEAGWVVPTAIHEAVSRNVRYFGKDELDRLQNQIMTGLPVLNGSRAEKQGLVQIGKLAKHGRVGTLPEIVQGLLEGRFKAAGLASKGVGLARVLMAPDAAKEVYGGAMAANAH